MTEERPRSLRPTPAQVFAGVKEAARTLFTIGAALIAMYRWIDSRADKASVEAQDRAILDALADETEARRALGAQLERERQRADADRDALLWLYTIRVGEKAAELEPDARKRARAADRARDRFEGYYREGMSAEDAFRRALGGGVP